MMMVSKIAVLPVLIILAACQNKLRVGGSVTPEVRARTPQPAAPVQAPAKPEFDLEDAVKTTGSVLILAIGYAEGTIGLDGKPTSAYYGHNDSGHRNIGLFSCIVCGSRTPEEADQYYLEAKIKPFKGRFEDAARGAMLPANHPMLAAAFFTLLTQSPLAATDRKGFLDRMAGLKTQGVNFESLLQLSVDSYRDPESNTFEDVRRFDNDESLIRADQKRRLVQVEEFLRKRGIEVYPRY